VKTGMIGVISFLLLLLLTEIESSALTIHPLMCLLGIPRAGMISRPPGGKVALIGYHRIKEATLRFKRTTTAGDFPPFEDSDPWNSQEVAPNPANPGGDEGPTFTSKGTSAVSNAGFGGVAVAFGKIEMTFGGGGDDRGVVHKLNCFLNSWQSRFAEVIPDGGGPWYFNFMEGPPGGQPIGNVI